MGNGGIQLPRHEEYPDYVTPDQRRRLARIAIAGQIARQKIARLEASIEPQLNRVRVREPTLIRIVEWAQKNGKTLSKLTPEEIRISVTTKGR